LKIRFLLVAALLFASCKTLPQWESQNPWGLFPSDGSLYLYLPVPEHRELLDTLLFRERDGSQNKGGASKGIVYLLDHTSELFLVLLGSDSGEFPSKSSSLRWILAGVGEYSSFLLRLSLTPEEGWEERKIRTSGYSLSYFQHRGSGLQVALPDTCLLIVSSGEIEFPLKQFVLPRTDPSLHFQPLGVNKQPPLPISLYIPKTGISFLTIFLEPELQPRNRESAIEAFRMELYRKDPLSYSATGSILFLKEEQARSMSVLVRLAFAGWFLQQGGKGGPNSIQILVNGTSIEFSGLPLSMETIAQFVQSMIDTIARTSSW